MRKRVGEFVAFLSVLLVFLWCCFVSGVDCNPVFAQESEASKESGIKVQILDCDAFLRDMTEEQRAVVEATYWEVFGQ